MSAMMAADLQQKQREAVAAVHEHQTPANIFVHTVPLPFWAFPMYQYDLACFGDIWTGTQEPRKINHLRDFGR